MTSVFTKIINRELPARILWENDGFIAIVPKDHFVNPGHMLVMPKVEVDYIFDLPDGIYAELWQHCKMLAGILRTITGAARIGIAVEGFSVPHVHVHLCPVNAVEELDPHRATVWTESERDAFTKQFREKLTAMDAR